MDLIGRCKVALAPHKKLPPDVLRSIFHFCNEGEMKFPLSKRGVLRITHVCSAWRQLALETPSLWSGVRILLSSTDRSRHYQALSSARQWLARAKDMPRSLFIQLTWLDSYDDPHLHDVWEQILKFMALYRLRDLRLVYPIDHLPLRLPDHAWPSIERLHLSGNDTVLNSSAKSLFSHFGTVSNLKHFEMSGGYNFHGLDNVVRWHQLRTLDFRQCEVTPSSCLNVLRQCPLLESCHLSLRKEPSFVSVVTSGEEKIVLANMDLLWLVFRDGSVASAFLQPLVIPNITTFFLWIECRSRGCTQLNCGMPALIGVIQRSAGMRHIHYLSIHTSLLLDVGILLELLPSLERISIESGHFTDNAIEWLSSGKIGPRLWEISSARMHDAADKILSMVESRYQTATKSSDIEQIESGLRPFSSVSIPCRVAVKSSRSYRRRIEYLSMCNVDVWLGQDFKSEDEYDDEY